MELRLSCTNPSIYQLINPLWNDDQAAGWSRSSTLLVLCDGNPAVTSGLPSKRSSNGASYSMLWHNHDLSKVLYSFRSDFIAIKPVAVIRILLNLYHKYDWRNSLTARFMGPTWGPSGAPRTQVDPMLAPRTLLSGYSSDGDVCRKLKDMDVLRINQFDLSHRNTTSIIN